MEHPPHTPRVYIAYGNTDGTLFAHSAVPPKIVISTASRTLVGDQPRLLSLSVGLLAEETSKEIVITEMGDGSVIKKEVHHLQRYTLERDQETIRFSPISECSTLFADV